jgi:hypothetical protein
MSKAKETDVTFVNFMSGGTGRAVRIVVGLAMIAIGLVLGGGWLALSIVGLVPLAAGALGLCLLAPLFHLPLRATGSPGA